MNDNNNGSIKMVGYLGIFILLLFIILPPLFRVLFPEEENTNVEKEKLVMNLTCTKDEDFVEYKLKTTISTNYVDSKISNSTFTYEVSANDSYFSSGVSIEEYESLKKIPNVDFSDKDNKHIIKIDYDKFNYSNEEILKDHSKVISEQMAIYSDDSFECTTAKKN